jgi:hypothetical protein
MVVYENVNGALSLTWTNTDQGDVLYPQVVDWNGDMWPDLIASERTLGVRVYLNTAAP